MQMLRQSGAIRIPLTVGLVLAILFVTQSGRADPPATVTADGSSWIRDGSSMVCQTRREYNADTDLLIDCGKGLKICTAELALRVN